MKKTKILLYHSYLSKMGGVETFTYNFCYNFRNDFDITVLYVNGNRKQIERLRKLVKLSRYNKDKTYNTDIYIRNSVWGLIPENINYKYYEKGCFFQGRGIVVSEKMTSEEFDKKKNMLFENSIFLTSPVYGELVERCTIPQVEFKIKGYSFRVLSGGKEANDYPHSFGMIAISEDESKILYFAYYNQDLDYIENMYDFVEDVFPGWENIGD